MNRKEKELIEGAITSLSGMYAGSWSINAALNKLRQALAEPEPHPVQEQYVGKAENAVWPKPESKGVVLPINDAENLSKLKPHCQHECAPCGICESQDILLDLLAKLKEAKNENNK